MKFESQVPQKKNEVQHHILYKNHKIIKLRKPSSHKEYFRHTNNYIKQYTGILQNILQTHTAQNNRNKTIQKKYQT